MTMETPDKKANQIRVFRQGFVPNNLLLEEYLKLVKEPGLPRNFSILGSNERIVDVSIAETCDFEIQLKEANRYMATRESAKMGVKDLIIRPLRREGVLLALQLVMQPVEKQQMLFTSAGLNMLELGQRRLAFGLEPLMLYANIPVSDLLPPRELENGIGELKESFESLSLRSLYQVTPAPYLISKNGPRPNPVAQDRREK